MRARSIFVAWFLLFWLVQDCEGKQAIVQDPLSSEQSFNTANHRYSSVDGYATVCSIRTERNAPAQMHRLRLRRHSRPCAYYANSSATFHLTLVGDLIFKLNSGPVDATHNYTRPNNYSARCSKTHKGSIEPH